MRMIASRALLRRVIEAMVAVCWFEAANVETIDAIVSNVIGAISAVFRQWKLGAARWVISQIAAVAAVRAARVIMAVVWPWPRVIDTSGPTVRQVVGNDSFIWQRPAIMAQQKIRRVVSMMLVRQVFGWFRGWFSVLIGVGCLVFRGFFVIFLGWVVLGCRKAEIAASLRSSQ